MEPKVDLAKAYKLYHEAALALNVAERNGVMVDLDYCYRTREDLTNKINQAAKEMDDTELVKKWKDSVGSKFSLFSGTQLANVLYNIYKLKVPKTTDSGAEATDVDALLKLTQYVPELETLIKIRKWTKARDTYIENFINEQVDGLIHPSFNLNLVSSYRISCTSPNLQNISARDPILSSIIREAFIPRPGHCWVECDYKALEVSSSAIFHKDRNMIKYLKENGDFHYDCAKKTFMLTDEHMTSKIRKAIKGLIVFSAFYGNYYKNMADNIWNYLLDEQPKINDGTLLRDHLRSRGIGGYNDLEKHIEKIEKWLWEDLFPDYGKWRKTIVEKYRKDWETCNYLGYRYNMPMSRNQIINMPNQGMASSFLLWTFVRTQEYLKSSKSKAIQLLVVHDSQNLSIPEDELDSLLNKIHTIGTQDIRNEFKFINVPLEIECEVSPVNKSWYHKQPYQLK